MRRISGWILGALSVLLAVAVTTLAFYMAVPITWDGLGKFAAIALFFPLHLLGISLVCALVAALAWRAHARFAVSLSVLAFMVSVGMALVPSLSIRPLAEQEKVELSLGDYVHNARRTNRGVPQPERSQMFAVLPDGTRLQLDVWPAEHPVVGASRPAVVVVHGGGWSEGTRGAKPDWDRWLSQLGFQVYDVDYRLAPPARWLDAVGDVKCALGWVFNHAAEQGVDAGQISLMGSSAGAHLAMLAAYSAGDEHLPTSCAVPAVTVRSVVNLYGPADLMQTYRFGGSKRYMQNALRDYIGGSPQDYPERYRLLSPINHVSSQSPPTITLMGTSDRVVDVGNAVLLDQALARSGTRHETWLLPATDHSFDANWGAFSTQFAKAKIKAFLLREH